MTDCRWDRDVKAHLLREHRSDCIAVGCKGCKPCTHDEHGNPVRHCRTRNRCTSHLGWDEAAQLVRDGVAKAIQAGKVTYDLARQREGATEVKASVFGEEIVKHMG